MKRKNISDFNYQGEPDFWYFLTTKLLKQVKISIPRVLGSLNMYLEKEKLGFYFHEEEGVVWATICQLYFLSKKEASLSILEKMSMFKGVKKVKEFENVIESAYREIEDHVKQNSLLGKTEEDFVRELFIKHSVKFKDVSDEKFELMEVLFLKCRTDSVISIYLTSLLCSPSRVWFDTTRYYMERRPGLLKRMFTSSDEWLFDRS